MNRAATVLATGLGFGEGPRWREDRLWFSDFHAHAVKSVNPAGEVRVEFRIEDQPSGLGWTPDGDLLVVSMVKRQVLRRTAKGVTSVHADLSKIATGHCNDLVVDADGRAYVGNFGFDLEAVAGRDGAGADFTKEAKAHLVLVEPNGTWRSAAEGLDFPNGSVITPDGKTLIVAETFGRRLTAFDVAAQGQLSNRRIWASLGDRLPDGICLDTEGAIWIANAAANECVRVAEGGEVLERIQTSQPCYACMLGGQSERTLFMMTAPPLFPDRNAALRPTGPSGKVEIAEVDTGHAGRP